MNRVILIFMVAIFASCTFTSSKSYVPKFNGGTGEIQAKIKALIDCEDLYFAGIHTTVNGSTESMLEFSLVNAASLPKRSDSVKMIAKKIAWTCRSGLVDPEEFDLYKVIFVTQTKHQQVTSNYSEQVVFKNEELSTGR